ncbi:MAG: FAD:protein FMN transferase, partial [Elusimicrobiota bacterium]|nr:FAD:protein FMN transferase [Elusimicrobiota bacterium]
MGTIMDFQAYGKNAKSALVKSVEIIKKLETLFSLKIETSEISRLNKNKFLKVSNETDELLKEALLLSQKTNSVYDLSIGALTDLWDIKSIKKQIKKIPQKYEIEQALKTCGYKNVQYDNDNNYRLINNTK